MYHRRKDAWDDEGFAQGLFKPNCTVYGRLATIDDVLEIWNHWTVAVLPIVAAL